MFLINLADLRQSHSWWNPLQLQKMRADFRHSWIFKDASGFENSRILKDASRFEKLTVGGFSEDLADLTCQVFKKLSVADRVDRDELCPRRKCGKNHHKLLHVAGGMESGESSDHGGPGMCHTPTPVALSRRCAAVERQ
jgi:hypothetical protein